MECCELYEYLSLVYDLFVADPPDGLGCEGVRAKFDTNVFELLYKDKCEKHAQSVADCYCCVSHCDKTCPNFSTPVVTGQATDEKQGGRRQPAETGCGRKEPANTDGGRKEPVMTDGDRKDSRMTDGGRKESAKMDDGRKKPAMTDSDGEQQNKPENGKPTEKESDKDGEIPVKGDTGQKPSLNGEGGGESSGAAPSMNDTDKNPTSPTSNTNITNSKTGIDAKLTSTTVCFHRSGEVQLRSGEKRAMSMLRVGDEVLVGGGRYSTVYMFSHASNEVAQFVNITTARESLVVTPGHLVHTPRGLVRAGDMGSGDRVMGGNGEVYRIVSVRRFIDYGVYNPHTLDGDIVVDGLLASTYTTHVEMQTAHSALAVFRGIWRLAGWHTDVLRCGAPWHLWRGHKTCTAW